MSSGATHWCYACRQPIVLDGRDPVCPYCDGGFVQELDELRGIAPNHNHTFSSQSGDFHQMPDIFDAIHAFMGQRGSDQRFGLMDAVDNFMRHRMAGRNSNFDVRGRSGSLPVPEQSWGVYSSGPYLIFHGQVPGFTLSAGSPRGGPRRVDFGDYFMGPGLEELIEQLTMNDQRGPAPAARSSIDAMPTIKITQAHLRSDSHCPVCKENLNWALKPERCHATIFTILTVLFLGWFSITHVLFAVLSCHLKDRLVPVVLEVGEEGMPATAAAVAAMIAPGAERTAIRTMEGEIHFHFCGHSARLTRTIIIILRLGEAALQPLLTRIMEQVIAVGPLIAKSILSSPG